MTSIRELGAADISYHFHVLNSSDMSMEHEKLEAITAWAHCARSSFCVLDVMHATNECFERIFNQISLQRPMLYLLNSCRLTSHSWCSALVFQTIADILDVLSLQDTKRLLQSTSSDETLLYLESALIEFDCCIICMRIAVCSRLKECWRASVFLLNLFYLDLPSRPRCVLLARMVMCWDIFNTSRECCYGLSRKVSLVGFC